MNIGMIGLGYWGKNILRNLLELKVLHTACDTDLEIIKKMERDFPDVNYTQNFDDILGNPEIDAIAISTPAVTHATLAIKAIQSNKDVFVEKPLSVKTEEAIELIKLARKKKRILMVGHILQYHPAVLKLKEMIETGELGKIQYIYSNRLNIGKLRIEENILWSFAPHDVSVILMLLEEEPTSVMSFGGKYITDGIFDTTLTTLEFKNNVKGHIFVSWLHPLKEQKLVVVGTKAMAVFDDLSEEKLFIFPHKIEFKNGKIPVAHKAEKYVVPIENKEPLKEELIHFINCIKKRKTPRTDGEEGLRVLRVLEKAERYLNNTYNSDIVVVKKNYFLHKSSFIDEDVEIGENTKIWHFSHILRNSRIGKDCIIGQNVMIGPDVNIGNKCKIQNNVSVYKGVTLEDEVFCGPSCVFTNVYTPRAFIERKKEFLPTLVKRGATIGANATILCGITIGKYAMIGAGAVVKKDIPDYGLVVGVPARQIGWVCKCGTTLKFVNNYSRCDYCGNEYEQKKDGIIQINKQND